MKKCFKCKTDKPETEFYRHARTTDGLLGKCKECTKSDARKTRRSNLDYYRAYDRKRAKLPHRLAYSVKNTKKTRGSKVGYMKAHNAVARALSLKKIRRQPCQMCGTKNWVQAHHDDYTKPLEIMWLCPVHHKARHVFLECLSLGNP